MKIYNYIQIFKVKFLEQFFYEIIVFDNKVLFDQLGNELI